VQPVCVSVHVSPVPVHGVLLHPTSSYFILYYETHAVAGGRCNRGHNRMVQSVCVSALHAHIRVHGVLLHPTSSCFILLHPASSDFILLHPASSYSILYYVCCNVCCLGRGRGRGRGEHRAVQPVCVSVRDPYVPECSSVSCFILLHPSKERRSPSESARDLVRSHQDDMGGCAGQLCTEVQRESRQLHCGKRGELSY
jgi:hypothetical protein